MPQYTENSLQNAIQDCTSGTNVAASARRWGIPRSTLQNRLNGTTTHAEAKEQFQRLTRTQELHLCGWILTQDAIGNPPTHKQVRDLAIRILAADGDSQPLGKNWIEGFLYHNPEVKTLRGKRLDF